MSMTLYDALQFSQNPFLTLFLRQIHTSDELFGVLPFFQEGGEAFSYEREVSLGDFNFIAPGGTVAKSNSKTERIAVTKREATEDFEIDNFTLDNQGSPVSPAARETAMKAKQAGRVIAGKLFTGTAIDGIDLSESAVMWGTSVTAILQASAYIRERAGSGELKWDDGTSTMYFRAPDDLTWGPGVDMTGGTGNYTLVSDSPSKWVVLSVAPAGLNANDTARITFTTSTNEFDSLPNLMNPSRVRASTGVDGDVLDFGILDELLDAVHNRDGQVVYVMPKVLRRKLLSLLRASGGIEPPYIMGSGLQVPRFNGIPVLVNDYIPTDESKGANADLTSVWCINLSRGPGLWMGAFGGQMGKFAEAADPRESPVLGFRLRDVGQNQQMSRNIWRLSWYGTPALGSDLSISRASEIQTGA